MGKPLMIQTEDDDRIEALKKKLNAKSKVQVVRSALALLEKEVDKIQKIAKWKKATMLVGESSREVMESFSSLNRFKKQYE